MAKTAKKVYQRTKKIAADALPLKIDADALSLKKTALKVET
jgi:hypothetical protein